MTGAALGWTALWAETSLAVAMSGAWVAQRRTNHSGWVEVIWTLAISGMGALLALSVHTIGAAVWRGVLVATLTATWGLRLSLQIAAQTLRASHNAGGHSPVANWSAASPMRAFGLLQVYGLIGSAMVVSVVLAAKAPHAHWRLEDMAATLLLIAALVGQAVADAQRARCRAETADRTKLCDVGLWKLMRRPNAIFASLAWLAYPVFAVDLTGSDHLGWLAFLAPAAVFWATCGRRAGEGADEPHAPMIVFPRAKPPPP